VNITSGVIFDWDGTLADTRSFLIKTFQASFNQLGCKVSDEFIDKRIGMGAHEIIEEALKNAGFSTDPKVIKEIVKKRTNIQMALTKTINLFEGTTLLLDALYGKVSIGLATMASRSIIEQILEEKNIRQYFDAIVTITDVSHSKPNPEIFITCARRMKRHPLDCIVVEDAIFGVQAAKKAGMRCIALTQGAYSQREFEEYNADLIVSSIRDREKILKFIITR